MDNQTNRNELLLQVLLHIKAGHVKANSGICYNIVRTVREMYHGVTSEQFAYREMVVDTALEAFQGLLENYHDIRYSWFSEDGPMGTLKDGYYKDFQFPVDGEEGYNRDTDHSSMFKNPKRIALLDWCIARLEGKP